MRFIFAFLFCASFVFAADYYVATNGNDDTGVGSIGNPWLTIDYGESQLSAGDTLFIRAGTYYESITIANSGTDGNPITIKAYSDEEVIVSGGASITEWTQCESDDAWLTFQSVINPNYASIYKTTIHEDNLPADVYKFFLYEDSVISRIARDPDADVGYGHNTDLYYPLEAEAYNETDFLVDSDVLTQADDYWNGAWIDVWSHQINSFVVRRVISDSDQSSTNVTFSVPLAGIIIEKDKYSLVNHPHILDSSGEFGFDPTPVDGYYTFYLWPTNTDNLASNITVPSESIGFHNLNKDYVIIDGLTIREYFDYAVLFIGNPQNHITDLTVQNCTVEDTGSTGIYFVYTDNSLIDNCIVNRTGDRGARINYAIVAQISNCTVNYTDSTNISMYAVNTGQMIDNIVYGSSGVHGNGITAYIDCEKMLIARNELHEALYTSSNNTDFVIFANVSTSATAMNTGTVNGVFCYLNNVILDSYRDAANALNLRTGTPTPQYYIVNNVLHGCGTWDEDNVADMTYNLWTGFNWRQSAGQGWLLEENSIDGTGYSLDDIFTDDDNWDYTIANDSPIISTGKDITTLLSNLGITGGSPWFPGFDFTKDKAGNSWASPPSMGAYEFGDTPDTPQITSPTVTAITTTTATLGANVTTSGGSAIIANGTVWDTSSSVIITDNPVDEGGHTTGVFTHGRTGLNAGTKIYYKGYATNDQGSVLTDEGSFYTDPTNQPTNIVFSSIGNTGMTISWDDGNGIGRIVVVKAGGAVDSPVVDGTEHSANTVFQSGAQLGSGNFVIYRSSGSSVTITGLVHSITYHVAIYEYAGTGVDAGLDYGINYQQDAPLTGNQATTTPPTGIYWIGT